MSIKAGAVSGLAPGAYVVLEVQDTGSGMSAAIQDRAFEPFFTTKSVGQGTGLGLSQVFGFVSQSGGTVRLASDARSGTCVSLYMPLAAAIPTEAPVALVRPFEALAAGTL